MACLNTNNYLGHNDWRLPNINELESLVTQGESSSATWLNGQGFSSVQSNDYWSSSTNAYSTSNAWFVGMYYGSVYYGDKSYNYYVWPVRSGQCGSLGNSIICLSKTGQTTKYATGDDGDLQKGVAWPTPRFTDTGDQTVTDNLTGLTWTKDANAPGSSSCSPGTTKTWQGALDYISCLNSSNYLGHNDWRLPNRKELFSLVDRSKYSPAIPTGHPFSNVQSSNYWSSSTYASSTSSAWLVHMDYGYVYDFDKSVNFYVWPVRSGQSGSLGNLDISDKTYTVTAPAVSNGMISPANETVIHGATTTFTVTPNTGYYIETVTGCGGTLLGNMYTTGGITSDCTVTALFAMNSYQLTVDKTGTGSGTIAANTGTLSWSDSNGTATYGYNAAVTVTATADSANSTFTGWGGDCTGTNSSASVTITADKSCTATFTLRTYTVTASAGSGGSISPADATIEHGAATSFVVIPDEGYHIYFVTGCSGFLSDKIYNTGTITGDCYVYATFAPTYSVAIDKYGTGSGTVKSSDKKINCGADCAETYSNAKQVTLTAKASPGSVFTGWSGDLCSGKALKCKVNINGIHNIIARFAPKNQKKTTLKIQKPKNGKIMSDDGKINCGRLSKLCSAKYFTGDSIRLLAISDDGYSVSEWKGITCAENGSNECLINISGNHKVVPVFTLGTDVSGPVQGLMITGILPVAAAEGSRITLSLNLPLTDNATYVVMFTDETGNAWLMCVDAGLDGNLDVTVPLMGLADGQTLQYKISLQHVASGSVTNDVSVSISAATSTGMTQDVLAQSVPQQIGSIVTEMTGTLGDLQADALMSSTNAIQVEKQLNGLSAAFESIQAEIEALSPEEFAVFDKLMKESGLSDMLESGLLNSMSRSKIDALRRVSEASDEGQFDFHHRMLFWDTSSFMVKILSKVAKAGEYACYVSVVYSGWATIAVCEIYGKLELALTVLAGVIDSWNATDLVELNFPLTGYQLSVDRSIQLIPTGVFQSESTFTETTINALVDLGLGKLAKKLEKMGGDQFKGAANEVVLAMTQKFATWLPSIGISLGAKIAGAATEGEQIKEAYVDLAAYDLSLVHLVSTFTGISQDTIKSYFDRIHIGLGDALSNSSVKVAESESAAEDGSYSTFANFDSPTNTIKGVSSGSGIVYITWFHFGTTDGWVDFPRWFTHHASFPISVSSIPCTYSLALSGKIFTYEGGTSSIIVTASPSGCSGNWMTTESLDWVSITSGDNGNGSGTVSYAVSANTGPSRTGTVTIGGKTFTIVQQAAPKCTFSVMSSSNYFVLGGGTGSITVTATPSGCSGSWSAISNVPWITIASGSSGSSSGVVSFTVSANTGAGRTGTITVAGRTLTVAQQTALCSSFSLSSSSASVSAADNTGSVNIVALPAGCISNWTATSSSSWITITSGNSGAGNGSLSYSVATNSGTSERIGTLTIAGQTFTVTQSHCGSTISPTSNNVAISGGTGVVNVTFPSGCSTVGWSASTTADWITITSGSSGTGNGTVSYSVAANNTTGGRTGTLTIAGQTFTVTQSYCAATISPADNSVGTSAGTGSINVTFPSGCNFVAWSAVDNKSWITVTGNGTGNGTVSYSFSANSGGSRTGTISIHDKTFTLSQDGVSIPPCSYSISPTSKNFTKDSGTGSITVTGSPSGCSGSWNTSESLDWVSITSGGSGSGSGSWTVNYSVTANSGASRSGTMTLAGKTFTVSQDTGESMGDMSFVLTWTWSNSSQTEGPDIDLWVTDPNGHTLSTSQLGGLGPCSDDGQIDADDLGGWGDGDGGGQERAYWPTGQSPTGTYAYGVRYYQGDGTANYSLRVYKGNTLYTTKTGTLSSTGSAITVGTVAK